MLPVALCNGAEPWTAKTNRADLIDPRLPPQLRHWQPQMRSGARGSHVELSFVVRPLFPQVYRNRQRYEALTRADATLNKVRLYLRLAHRWRWLSNGQSEHVSRMVVEIGRLLGAWMQKTPQSG